MGSVGAAIANRGFVHGLRETLVAWDVDGRGGKLIPLGELATNLHPKSGRCIGAELGISLRRMSMGTITRP